MQAKEDMLSKRSGSRQLHSEKLSAPAEPARLIWSRLLAALALLCLATAAEAARRVAEALYQGVMRIEPRYPQYGEQKALAGCFDWQRSTPDKPDVRYLAVSTPHRRGRGMVSTGRLASNALDRCQRAQRRNDAPCVCHEIDRNGRNRLEPPDDFVRRFR